MKSTSKILKVHEFDRRALTVGASEPTQSAGTKRPAAQPTAVVVEEILAEAQRQAAVALQEAREEAHRIVAEAQAAATAAVNAARNEGYQAGYESGLAAAEEQMRQQVQAIAQIVGNATVDKARLIRECEAEMVALVIDVARKVIDREVSLDHSIVLKLVESALQKVAGQVVLRIRVSPVDFDLVKNHWSERQGTGEGIAQAEIVADKRIKPGGCVIDTQGGSVDAQIDTQLAEIKKAFDTINELM